MRNNISKLLFILTLMIITSMGWSAVTELSFNSTMGTYTEISGGTVLGSSTNDEQVFNNVPLGFDFSYNSQTYNTVSISCNGFIAMGSTVITSNTPISTGTSNNVIVPMSRNLLSRSNGSLMTLLTGTEPNRVFTIQWKNYRRSPTQCANDSLNFQIQLLEHNNVVKFAYGYFKAVNFSTAGAVQCGLRGASNTDFYVRTTTTNWAQTAVGASNDATCIMNSTIIPSNGLVFTWTPPIIGEVPNPAVINSPLNNATNVGLSTSLHWLDGGGAPTGYKVYFGTDNPPANLVNGTEITTLSYTPASSLVYGTTYYWKIVPFNATGDALNCPLWTFTTLPDPTVTSYPYSENWDSVTAPVVPAAWTVVNANNDAFTWVSVNTGANSAPNAVRCNYNSSSAIAMDDWLISPPLVVTTGTYYQVEFRYKAFSASYNEKLEIKLGNSNNPTALTNQIYNNTAINNTNYLVGTAYFTPDTNGTYYFGLHAFSSANTYAILIDDISVSSFLPVFNPPQNLTASAGWNGTITLNWQAPTARPIAGYNVYRNNVLLTPSPISQLTYADNTVMPDSVYNYYVVASYSFPTGTSVPSNIVTITPTFNAPSNLNATTGNGAVTLTWQAPAARSLTGYKVYRDAALITPSTITPTTYTDNTVTVGISHSYYVVAIYTNPTSVSLPTNTVNIIPVFNPPVNLAAVSGTNVVNLTWQAPTGSTPTGYKVYRNAVALTASPITVLLYNDTTGNAGTSYQYYVTAIYANPAGESLPSNTVNAASTPPVNPPTDLSVTISAPNVVLNWVAPASRNDLDKVSQSTTTRETIGYKVYRNSSLIASINDAGVTTYTDTNLPANTYQYSVSTLDTAGESPQCSPVTAIMPAYFGPPTNLDAVGGPTSIVITWSAPNPIIGNLSGYRIFRNGNVLGHGIITGTTYTDTAILVGTEYTYYVKAYYTNPTGESVASNSDTATGGTPLNPVYNLQGTAAQDNVSLTWTPPGGPILQDWVHFDDSVNAFLFGSNGAINFDIAARFTQTELSGIADRYLTKVRFFPGSATCVYTVKIYTGGTSLTNPGILADTVRVQNPVINSWNVVNLHTPVPIPTSGELRIAINCNSQAGNPAGCDDGPSDPYKGNVLFLNNEWTILSLVTNPPADYNWNIQGFVVNFIGREEPMILSHATEPSVTETFNAPKLTMLPSLNRIAAEPLRNDTRSLLGYKVYRDGAPIATINDYTISNYTDSGLANATYIYTVTALYTNGESAPCTPVSISVNVPVIPVAMNQGFEAFDNFALNFGNWAQIDSDHSTTATIQNVTFDHSGEAMSFIIFNPSATTPPLTSLSAHGGQKMAACFSATTAPNNDILISPRFRVGTENSISLWVKSYTAQYGLERYRVGYSESENPTPASFTWLTGPNYVEAPVDWTHITFSIPQAMNAHYLRFGIKCESNDAFMFLVDDVVLQGNNIVDNDDNVIPVDNTELLGNYPNPFNPETVITYNVKNDDQVSIEVYNIKGEKIKTLVNNRIKSGAHEVTWLGDDENGNKVTSGVYFYRMTSGRYSSTKKMILLK